MNKKLIRLVVKNIIFLMLLVVVCLILLLPLLFNHKISGWNWNFYDFVFAGVLLYGIGFFYIVLARKVKKHKVLLAFLFILGVVYIWAEFAVGIFTNLGS